MRYDSLSAPTSTVHPGSGLDFARELLTGAVAYHGRLLVLDRESAPESTGHGIPMPQLVDAGPGRAGGGEEEEGGLRAVLHHMQRAAVQGGLATPAAWVVRAQAVRQRAAEFSYVRTP